MHNCMLISISILFAPGMYSYIAVAQDIYTSAVRRPTGAGPGRGQSQASGPPALPHWKMHKYNNNYNDNLISFHIFEYTLMYVQTFWNNIKHIYEKWYKNYICFMPKNKLVSNNIRNYKMRKSVSNERAAKSPATSWYYMLCVCLYICCYISLCSHQYNAICSTSNL